MIRDIVTVIQSPKNKELKVDNPYSLCLILYVAPFLHRESLHTKREI